MSMEKLKKLVLDNFPQAELKVNILWISIVGKENVLVQYLPHFGLRFTNHISFICVSGRAHEPIDVSTASKGYMASTGISCNGKGERRI